jgi:LmbE family N-acetylglucosaminyl deacetylase
MNWRADSEKSWGKISKLLQTEPPDSDARLLVLAAHPDDETIGASALLSRFPHSFVVFLTDGAPRDTRLWSSGLNCSREEYACIRQQEAECALKCAGVSAANIFYLDAVDQEATFAIARLTAALANLLERLCPAVVITHAYEGGHPDHDSAALVARLALSMVSQRAGPPAMEMTSYHVRGGRCVTGEFLEQHPARELRFELLKEERERKRQMMNAYASQRLVLGKFPADRECLRLAPEYDFSKPPHEGRLWYECMDWPMTGSRWCELAVAALAGLREHACH